MRASLVLALAAVAGSAQAMPQASPSVTSVSLPTSFATPSFSVSNTFTPITTFATPEDTKPTTIFGVGADGSTYAFSYNVPASTVPAVTKTELDASLAAAGFPTSQNNLNPPTQHLQINKGGSLLGRNMAPAWSFGAFVGTAVGAAAAVLML